MMPTILWALGVFTAALLVKRLLKEGRRVAAEFNDGHQSSANGAKPVQTLQRDPVTGIYRPD